MRAGVHRMLEHSCGRVTGVHHRREVTCCRLMCAKWCASGRAGRLFNAGGYVGHEDQHREQRADDAGNRRAAIHCGAGGMFADMCAL
jgi:hypothetical protein